MCRLLGYQGIAVVIEELLKIVKALVSIVSHHKHKHYFSVTHEESCKTVALMVFFL